MNVSRVGFSNCASADYETELTVCPVMRKKYTNMRKKYTKNIIGKEIERKFLATNLLDGLSSTTMWQGYLQLEKERVVRIRTLEKDGSKRTYLQGIGDASGMN